MTCCPECGKPAEVGLFKLYCTTKGCANFSAPKVVAGPPVSTSWWMLGEPQPSRVFLGRTTVPIHSKMHATILLHARDISGHGNVTWGDGATTKNPDGLYPIDVLIKLCHGSYERSELQRAIVDLLEGGE